MDKENFRKTIFLKEKAQMASPHQIKINIEPSATDKIHFSQKIDNANNNDCSSQLSNSDWTLCAKHFKIFILVTIWLVSSAALMINQVNVQDTHQISIPKDISQSYIINEKPHNNKIRVMLEGAFLPSYYSNLSENWLNVWLQLIEVKQLPISTNEIKSSNIINVENITDVWTIPLVTETLIGVVPEVVYQKVFSIESFINDNTSYNILQMQFTTNLNTNFPISMGINLEPINTERGIIYAALILVGLYLLIIFEVIHRTLAAMLASTMSIAVLASLNARPTMDEIVSWIDIETLLLLFSMMTLVTIFGETGVFDYTSVLAYKLTGGKTWPLINVLCLITIIFSSFLDNVTTALLITPITIKLCEIMKLKPVKILMFTVIYNNIGGAITPIGDPPNVIIASNKEVLKNGITFGIFTFHMAAGCVLALLVVYGYLRIQYRNISDLKDTEPAEVQDLKREIAVWQRAAASLGSYSKDEDSVKISLLKKSERLQGILKGINNVSNTDEEYTTNLEDLEKQYPIKDKVLLIKSGIIFVLVICTFFLHSIPVLSKLGLGWTALLGALLLLLVYERDGIEGIFSRIEWATLLFFASLFIVMEALARLGLIEWIGKKTQDIILTVGPDSRLAVAIILLLWVSGVASAFVDNLPLTTMMIRIAADLANNRELNLPLQPLIWALSFGACLGGNGSLFGSSSNIICAGVAEQHGYRFTFFQFFRIGFPIMVSTLLVINVYLIICHVVLQWH